MKCMDRPSVTEMDRGDVYEMDRQTNCQKKNENATSMSSYESEVKNTQNFHNFYGFMICLDIF